jgi:hypothetical protein
MEMASALSATTATTASTASAQYNKYNSKTDKWYSIPLYPAVLPKFNMLGSKGSSSSERVSITQDSDIKFFPTKTHTYEVLENGYYSCVNAPKESCQWTIYRDDAGIFYSYVKYGGGFWYATILELEIL